MINLEWKYDFGTLKAKVKAFPYSILSVWAGADPGVQAVSPQVTVSHPPGGRLHAITFSQAYGYLPSRRASPPPLWPVPSYTAWRQKHI